MGMPAPLQWSSTLASDQRGLFKHPGMPIYRPKSWSCGVFKMLGVYPSPPNFFRSNPSSSHHVSVAVIVGALVSVVNFSSSDNSPRTPGGTVSYYVNKVLAAVLSLHNVLLTKPSPVPDDCIDHRWMWFKGCLGALDGTHISVLVPTDDKPRYRSRKGQISTNVLGVCDRQMQFVYLLPGWEGSAGDSRVLKDAVSHADGLKVPQGCYYLCDNAYANCNGFLTPFKAVRYHLKKFGPGTEAPQNPKELFNMRHTKARNVIERAFGVLKMRWGILRSASYYPIRTQIRLIMACFLLHNFIRREMEVDPVELELDTNMNVENAEDDGVSGDYVDCVEPSSDWTHFRDSLAVNMWNNR
ncbi:uncharacterized protein LOC121800982 [Salvia splendens]|uniref:uncharacterized protein LOC121800982 n=1 Tax=Salvia splendens TaxID=180675 RepID=UPI001C264381|nr:uncharacterized protein LOC121800982 [Salvia splendens]